MGALYDLVGFSTTTTGTGTITAGSALTGLRPLSTAPDGTVISYSIKSASGQYETGTGTVGASGTTLTRTLLSSSTSSLLDLSGTSEVRCSPNAADFAGLPSGVSSPGVGALDFATGGLTANRPSAKVTQTFNNSGVSFTAIQIELTDTASAATSKMIDGKIGGSSEFSVFKDGRVQTTMVGGSVRSNFNGFLFGNVVNAYAENGISFRFGVGYLSVGNSHTIRLWEDANYTLAFRNGNNGNTLRTYGTWTDASNGRWLEQSMTTAGVAVIRPTGNGSGASGNVLHISGLPTSNPGPGILWNDAGTVKVGT